MALIEIDGLYTVLNSMGGSFHGELLVITRGCIYRYTEYKDGSFLGDELDEHPLF